MILQIINFFTRKTKHQNAISYKYVHIMLNDKFMLPFIEFMNENFDNKKQCFIYFMTSADNFEIPLKYKNVYVINRFEDLNINTKKVRKIFLHSLPANTTIPYLFQNKYLLKYCYWIIWGYDLYNINSESEAAKYVKNNVKAVITNFDKDTYHKKYNPNKKVLPLPFYSSVVKKEFLDNAKKENNDYITVQINNSADFSTLEMLDILAKFASKNIHVTTILSYAKKEYSEEIIKRGKELFGDKFNAITEYLCPKEYAKHIKNIDILILNQNRQQGVGNIRCNLYLGHKVFIRKEITTYNGFISKDFKIFDTNEIKTMNFQQFITMAEDDREKNKRLIKGYFDNTEIIKSWEIFYKDK